MVLFHKILAPAEGERGIKMNRRRLVLTKVVLEQENTAAALLIKAEDGWAPLEFLSTSAKRTGDLNLIIEPGETMTFKARQESFFGPTTMANGVAVGGQVRLHMYGNLEEVVNEMEPDAKKRRVAVGSQGA
mmetsp:Transcript_46128/g.139812  ORF Transcript_46128/g.139812 Transcript_46128/m.139812 type:complete len:131 (-) Transcript_46128:122-514(-)